MKQRTGFTLIEVLVAVGIGLAVLAFVLANYSRGGKDSVLSRETSLLVSRLRYAQELTSSGSILRYQEYSHTGSTCTCNPNAPDTDPSSCKKTNQCHSIKTGETNPPNPWPESTPATCVCCPADAGDVDSKCNKGKDTPQGGFAVGFSCLNTNGSEVKAYGSDVPQVFYARERYYLVADRVKCIGAPGWEGCFPLNSPPVDDRADSSGSDGIISMYYQDYKGDTTKEKYIVDPNVQIYNLRVTYTSPISLPAISALPVANKASFTCADSSPWYRYTAVYPALTVPGTAEKVPWDYPIQATVRFVPPDGRTLDLNDNIYAYAPTATGADLANPVKSVEVMLKLKNRNTDCRVVTITKPGAISQAVDADCAF